MSPYDISNNSKQTGLVSKFRITTSDELDMVFGLVTWPAAKPEVRHIQFLEGLEKYQRLIRAGNLGVLPLSDDHWLVQLRAMRFNSKDRSTLSNVTLNDLDNLLEGDSKGALMQHGALEVGTREEIFGDTSRNRNVLSMKFQAHDVKPVAVAYALTRVLAVMHDFGLDE